MLPVVDFEIAVLSQKTFINLFSKMLIVCIISNVKNIVVDILILSSFCLSCESKISYFVLFLLVHMASILCRIHLVVLAL